MPTGREVPKQCSSRKGVFLLLPWVWQEGPQNQAVPWGLHSNTEQEVISPLHGPSPSLSFKWKVFWWYNIVYPFLCIVSLLGWSHSSFRWTIYHLLDHEEPHLKPTKRNSQPTEILNSEHNSETGHDFGVFLWEEDDAFSVGHRYLNEIRCAIFGIRYMEKRKCVDVGTEKVVNNE